MVDGMGGYDPIHEQVLNFDLDDVDNGLSFVIGRGEQTPPIAYDKKTLRMVEDNQALRVWRRDRATREAVINAATGLHGPLPTITEGEEHSHTQQAEAAQAGTGQHLGSAASHETAETAPQEPVTRQMVEGPTRGTPMVRDRWDNEIPVPGYIVQYPTWVHEALEGQNGAAAP